MDHDVFISYSKQDKTEANAVCATLEGRGIRCWIAPRDIVPGTSWPAAIVEAIGNSKVFVLVFSDRSNQSKQVAKEVGEAFDSEIPIIPLRLDDVKPSREMSYYIRSTHWLDAMTPPLERHLEELGNTVTSFLSVEVIDRPLSAEPVYTAPQQKRSPLPAWATVLIAAAAILVIGGIGFWAFSRKGSFFSSTTPIGVASFTEDASAKSLADDQKGGETSPPVWSGWRNLSFNIPNETSWQQSGENTYTIIANPSSDTIAWSDEIITGDFILTAEVSHTSRLGAAMIIVYGDGIGFSYGNLIVHYGSLTNGQGWAAFEAHSIYDDGKLLVSNNGDFYLSDEATTLTIEISDRKANLYADDQKVTSVFLPSEINHMGRIGLLQHWEQPVGANYSNIRIRTMADNE